MLKNAIEFLRTDWRISGINVIHVRICSCIIREANMLKKSTNSAII
jgi:hypothetical protein